MKLNVTYNKIIYSKQIDIAVGLLGNAKKRTRRMQWKTWVWWTTRQHNQHETNERTKKNGNKKEIEWNIQGIVNIHT